MGFQRFAAFVKFDGIFQRYLPAFQFGNDLFQLLQRLFEREPGYPVCFRGISEFSCQCFVPYFQVGAAGCGRAKTYF